VESCCECDNEPWSSIKARKLSSGCTAAGLLSGAQLYRVWLVELGWVGWLVDWLVS
jgi:hypothetical protein